ncbi:MAG: glycoside hydrolase family 3 N-terminal domain-containing protein [Bacteroidota bacterium]
MNRFLLPALLFLFLLNPGVGFCGPADSVWVDSVYKSLTLEQRIAQLLVIRAYSCNDSLYGDSLTKIIQQYDVGGVCFFKGSPVKQAILTNHLQQAAPTPVLITIDAEWGLGMRLDSAFSFPRQMALGALSEDTLIYEMGRIIAKSCRRIGVHVNFAPVADINNNPNNPVISFRSFGENRDVVARRSILYMKGMQDEGVIAVAKHFPGHGDTDMDSHLSLPVINHSQQRLDSVELFPFAALVRAGVKGIMVGHLYVPCFDSAKNLPATLSRNLITGELIGKLGFKGFVVTDALDMQGVTKYFKPGEIEVKALQAGNDILLLPQHVDAAIAGIKTAVDSSWLSMDLVERKCRHILALKAELGLRKRPVISLQNLVRDINPPEAEILRQQMVDASVTLVRNRLQMIPLTALDHRKIAILSVGDSLPTVFQKTLSRYMAPTMFNVPKKFSKALADSISRMVMPFDIVIVGIHNITSNVADSFGVTHAMHRLIDTITRANRTILALFGTPYSMVHLPGLNRPEAIVVAYQDNQGTELTAAEIIMGGRGARGKLPVTAAIFPVGCGETTDKSRLETIMPEEIGLPRESLNVIDSIAMAGIRARAYPGCQILVAKDGKIFYEKAFGTPRYEDTVKVTAGELYDLASVTKVAATTLAIMKLFDEGKLRLDDSLAAFLPFLKGSNKARMRIRDVMTHQAGLQDWIPFYKSTLLNGRPDPAVYRQEASASFPARVASNLYIRKGYSDTIFSRIRTSPLRDTRDYKYSDLGFYLLRLVVEQISGQPFEKYLETTWYRPLGLTAIGFNPRERFNISRIIPTEYDTGFRKQLVWGDVHDPGAAMLGGISGHAGLFSDVYDLAVILQMLLQDGSYGGKQYLSPSTVKEFTRVQFPEKGNRRGIGFDKPLLHFSTDSPACRSASAQSFGHSGFTGTYIWADPENNLIYIFLSNRVCPSAANQKLSEMNIRTNIHQSVYDLLHKYQIK